MSLAKPLGLWKPLLFIILIIILFIGARSFDLGARVGELRSWIDSLGAWGPLVFLFLYIVGVVALLPGSVLTILASILFGSLWGVIVVIFGATIGASLAFLIARYFARGAIEKRLAQNEKFSRLDRMTEDYGSIIVAITRLLPIFPFNLLNYAFGLTRIRFWTYVGWSWLCMLPGTILYVVGIDAVTTSLAEGRIPWVLVGILVLIGLILTLLVHQARAKLKARPTEIQP